jgi:hypothetical protein
MVVLFLAHQRYLKFFGGVGAMKITMTLPSSSSSLPKLELVLAGSWGFIHQYWRLLVLAGAMKITMTLPSSSSSLPKLELVLAGNWGFIHQYWRLLVLAVVLDYIAIIMVFLLATIHFLILIIVVLFVLPSPETIGSKVSGLSTIIATKPFEINCWTPLSST